MRLVADMTSRDLLAALLLGILLQPLFRAIDLILKQVAKRDDLDARGRVEAVDRGAGAASAAADQPHDLTA